MFAFRTKQANQNDATQSEELVRHFPFADLKYATNNFDDALFLGDGGFGKVCKGHMDNGSAIVAIKRLDSASRQGKKEFLTEVKTLSKLRHINVVTLIGYCKNSKEMLLVYPYMPKGTLGNHLHSFSRVRGHVGISPLTWERRLNICIGIARGLAHLHGGTGQCLIHGDVKSSNILLDEDWIPKISDFGLARNIISLSHTHSTNRVAGTLGYLAPEYALDGQVSNKTDVYSFGVVMLEVISGRHAMGSGIIGLVPQALEHIDKGRLDSIVDPSLTGQVSPDSLKCFLQIATKSLHPDPKERPTMAEVVWSLELALMSQHQGTIAKVFKDISAIPQGIDCWHSMKKYNYSTSGSSRDMHQEQEQLSNGSSQTCPQFLVNENQPTTYYFDEPVVIGQNCGSKVSRVCLDGPSNKGSTKYGRRTRIAKVSKERSRTLQIKDQMESMSRHQGLDVQMDEDNQASKSMASLTTRTSTTMRPRNGEEHSGNLDIAIGHKRSTETEISPESEDSQGLVGQASSPETMPSLKRIVNDDAEASLAKPTDYLDSSMHNDYNTDQCKVEHKAISEVLEVSPTKVTTIQKEHIKTTAIVEVLGIELQSQVPGIEIVTNEVVSSQQEESSVACRHKIFHEKSQTHEFDIEATEVKELSSKNEEQMRVEDNKQRIGTSARRSFALDQGDDKRIKILKSTDGMITIRDQFGVELTIDFEALTGIRENIRPKLLQIIELRPDTFMQIGKLSYFFVKLVMEAFGGFLELLESTILNKASPKVFDEMLHMLQDLKRNLLNVEWIEERVRAMSTQLKFDRIKSELKLTTLKIIDCEEQLAHLKEKKTKLEREAYQLEKRPYAHFDMEGNAAQVLF